MSKGFRPGVMSIKECDILDLTAQIQDTAKHLADDEKLLILTIMKKFLPDYIATDEDLRDIAIARQELENGETISHDDIDWD